MPRPALKNVSTAALQAELARRAAQLAKLLKLKEQVDRDIAELQGIAGQLSYLNTQTDRLWTFQW